jgi:UDP-N-acetylmuramyl pentapeptide phosphotransferase/UDP-N-acetylglucosamine-1-phosphate transferase
MLYFVLFSIVLFLLSFSLTLIVKNIALKNKVLDIPNDRSSHDNPTPRGGGLAIVITWFTGISLLFSFNLLETKLFFALLCGLLLAIVSLIDDLKGLSPIIRLSVQTLSALSALFFVGGFNPIQIAGIKVESVFLLYPVAIIGIVWFINLYNFLDGIDGYASLEAMTIASVMLIFTHNWVNIVLIVSVAGFLYWNWPKAKIFMGDIGSTQLGFVLVILGIYFHNGSDFSIIQWLMITSLFWFDATLTLFRRWKKKEKLSIAHRKHIYQRAVQAGLSHKQTILLSLSLNFIISGLIYISVIKINLLLPLFLITLIMLYGVARIIDSKVPFK